MDDATTAKWMSKAIGQATSSAKLCVVGCLPGADPIIDVEGLGAITLPLKRTTAKELVACCRVAPYGKGTQTYCTIRRTIAGKLPFPRHRSRCCSRRLRLAVVTKACRM